MLVLGIETSCDETGVAVYDSKKGLLSNELYSQKSYIKSMEAWFPSLLLETM